MITQMNTMLSSEVCRIYKVIPVVLVGIKQPEIIFGNLINKLNYESKSKRW